MRASIVALLLVFAPSLRADNLDCTKAEKPVEKVICSDGRLNAADASLAAIYRTDLAQLTSASIGLLRADQVEWLAWAQQLCHMDDGSPSNTEIVACLQPLYADRVKMLRKAVFRLNGLSFLVRTQYLAAPDAVQVKTVEPHPGFGTLQAKWPVADSTDEDWVAWNRATESGLLRMSGPLNNSPALMQWTDELAVAADTTVEADLKSVEHDRATAGLSYETMAHGSAHPNEDWETQTYLLSEHRALRADDVFAPAVDWKTALAAACWQQMSTSDKKSYIYKQIKGPEAREIQENLLDVRHWTLEHNGLHISYPEYSVSPRYATMNDTVIKWSDIQGLLSPRFLLP